MTPFRNPSHSTPSWTRRGETVAEIVKRKAEDCGATMLVVCHHSKKWYEDFLVGSITKYLMDRSDLNLVVVH